MLKYILFHETYLQNEFEIMFWKHQNELLYSNTYIFNKRNKIPLLVSDLISSQLKYLNKHTADEKPNA